MWVLCEVRRPSAPGLKTQPCPQSQVYVTAKVLPEVSAFQAYSQVVEAGP
jgi:hypothetical protein